jgi:hypothetical protein
VAQKHAAGFQSSAPFRKRLGRHRTPFSPVLAGLILGFSEAYRRRTGTRFPTDEQKSMQRELLGLMRNLFGDLMLHTVLKDSAEIDNASARLMTVYELEHPVTSRETYQRCITYLNGVNAEIETQIRLTWPSHIGRLRAEGVL